MKQTSNSGPELGLVFLTIIGGSTALWLANQPGAWPHPLIASIMDRAGHPLPAGGRALIGGAVAGLVAMLFGAWLDVKAKAAQRRAAVRRAEREAVEDAKVREQIGGSANKTAAGGLANVIAEETKPKSNRATPAYVAGCIAVCIAVLLVDLYFF